MRIAVLMLAGALMLGCSKNEKTNTAAAGEGGQAAAPEEAAAVTDTNPTQAPNQYKVELDTTKGPIIIDVRRDWAPNGADRFYELVQNGYFTNVAFFRVIDGFMAQVGISGDPATNAVWRTRRIEDDPVKASNTRGTVTFATSGPDSRTTQFFINFVDNSRLDEDGFRAVWQGRGHDRRRRPLLGLRRRCTSRTRPVAGGDAIPRQRVPERELPRARLYQERQSHRLTGPRTRPAST